LSEQRAKAKTRERAARIHHERIERLRHRELHPNYNGKGEPEVVPCYQLAKILNEWIEKYVADRPLRMAEDGGAFGETFMGPIAWLVDKTGLNERSIHRIIKEEIKVVSLTQADLLLTAIDRHLSEVQVVPNPNWSLERWIDYMKERGC
jgi:hypothetical protein